MNNVLKAKEKEITGQWTPEERERLSKLKQGSSEWIHAHSRGILTMGSAGIVMGNSRFSNSYKDLLRYMVWGIPMIANAERNPAICHGTRMEPLVRDLYLDEKRCKDPKIDVSLSGLNVSPKDPRFGASFDGLVKCGNGEQGLLEIKCRYRSTMETAFPSERDQIQGTMGLFGLPWCDFVVHVGKTLVITRYAFDKDYFEKRLYPALVKFYQDLYLPLRVEKDKGRLKEGVVECLNKEN